MEIIVFVVIVFFVLALFGGIPGMVASSRGHNFWLFALLGIFISPILAILLAFIITPPAGGGRRRSRKRGREGRGDTRRMPQRATKRRLRA